MDFWEERPEMGRAVIEDHSDDRERDDVAGTQAGKGVMNMRNVEEPEWQVSGIGNAGCRARSYQR